MQTSAVRANFVKAFRDFYGVEPSANYVDTYTTAEMVEQVHSLHASDVVLRGGKADPTAEILLVNELPQGSTTEDELDHYWTFEDID